MLDSIGSTSWHNRHFECFRRLNRLLVDNEVAHPTIMIIGPGGVCRLLGGLLNDSSSVNASAFRRLVGDAARYGDQLLRRIPFMPLESLEPAELSRAVSLPHELIVVDRSARILKAVRRQMPGVHVIPLDIESAAPPEPADVVVAFNVLSRLAAPDRGMIHVASAVKRGGYLLIDDRSASAFLQSVGGFVDVAPKIHQRA